VLLKNNASVLPLDSTKTIAVVGSACAAANNIPAQLFKWDLGSYFTVGGSGRVIGLNPVNLVSALRAASYKLVESLSDDVNAAVSVLARADVGIVCGGAWSTEGTDRSSLRLDQDDFIGRVLNQAKIPMVVAAIAPGSITTSWRDKAAAVLLMFLGGEQTGNAFVDVLSGKVNPVGRLPVSLPVNENDMVAPCPDTNCPYTEALFVGWRGLEGKPVAFPFGHGLSYTKFGYAWDQPPNTNCGSGVAICFSITIKNEGAVPGAEVAQVYLGFPQASNSPAKQLKGFQKTSVLAASASSTLSFRLTTAELSVWSVTEGNWQAVKGSFTVMVGSSSRDIKLQDQVNVQ